MVLWENRRCRTAAGRAAGEAELFGSRLFGDCSTVHADLAASDTLFAITKDVSLDNG